MTNKNKWLSKWTFAELIDVQANRWNNWIK